jgi:DNA-binding protein H-NS
MAQTYVQIQKQIEQLQREAESLRSSEVKGVVDRIKVAISHYGLTAADLGLARGAGNAAAKLKTATKSSGNSTAKYGDGSGAVWSGRGPRPRWLRDALNAGRSIEDFLLGARAKAPKLTRAAALEVDATTPTATAPVKKSKRAPSKVAYADGAGNSWSGRGPRPRWLKGELEAGKSLQDFVK